MYLKELQVTTINSSIYVGRKSTMKLPEDKMQWMNVPGLTLKKSVWLTSGNISHHILYHQETNMTNKLMEKNLYKF